MIIKHIFLLIINIFIIYGNSLLNEKTFIDSNRKLLENICANLKIEDSSNLIKCYYSSIYMNEYFWIISFIINERKDFKSIMVLPNDIKNSNCIEINKNQCITMANFKIIDNSVIIEYELLEEMSNVINIECKVKNKTVRSSLNTLWMGPLEKISEINENQSLILGRGYEELIDFMNPVEDLSNIICTDIKRYLYTRSYVEKLKETIWKLIGEYIEIEKPIYVNIPMKFDNEKIDTPICLELSENLKKIDKMGKIKIFSNKEIVILQKEKIDGCNFKDEKINILTWMLIAPIK